MLKCILCWGLTDSPLSLSDPVESHSNADFIVRGYFDFCFKNLNCISIAICRECWQTVEHFHIFNRKIHSIHGQPFAFENDICPKSLETIALESEKVPIPEWIEAKEDNNESEEHSNDSNDAIYT